MCIQPVIKDVGIMHSIMYCSRCLESWQRVGRELADDF